LTPESRAALHRRLRAVPHVAYTADPSDSDSEYAVWTPADPAHAPPAEFPPLTEQAANLAGAVVRSIASGLKRRTPEQQAEIMAICRECPEFSSGRCRICGCRLKVKIALASESCPLDPPKWGPPEDHAR
jgi:hypothetical protein